MPESLEERMKWLYPDPTQPCICDHEYKGLGILYGVSMGKGWVRTSTDPHCLHHGTEAERIRKENLKHL
jgi:hypothetical protein